MRIAKVLAVLILPWLSAFVHGQGGMLGDFSPGSLFPNPGLLGTNPGAPSFGSDTLGPGFLNLGPGFDSANPAGLSGPAPGVPVFGSSNPGGFLTGPNFKTLGPGSILAGPNFSPSGPGRILAGPDFNQPGPGGILIGPSFSPAGQGSILTGPNFNPPGPGGLLNGPNFNLPGPGSISTGPSFSSPGSLGGGTGPGFQASPSRPAYSPGPPSAGPPGPSSATGVSGPPGSSAVAHRRTHHAPSSSQRSNRRAPNPSQPDGGNKCHPHKSGLYKPPKDPLGGLKVVCLFNTKTSEGVFTPANVDPCLCTHLNYEFAMLDPKTYEMISGEPHMDITLGYYQAAVDLRNKTNPDLKVMLSIGGWNDSTAKYSELASDPDRRVNFAQKAVSFLRGHDFDGLDLSWQYPNCWQGAIGISPKDKQNFVLLLKDLREAFDEANLLLSISVGAIQREINVAYDVPEISKLVDHINVMTYDMHGPWEKVTGHHTQFEPTPNDRDPTTNVKAAMQVWIDKGAEPKKLILGLASYGKTFTLADPTNYGLGAPAIGPGRPGAESGNGGLLFYREICDCLNNGTFTEEEDKLAGFFAHGGGDQWACYDPPAMMVRKAKYVVEKGMGGVMLKDLSGDDFQGRCFSMPFPLLKMTRFEIMNMVKKSQRTR